MSPSRFSLRNLMIVTGVVGVLLGLGVRHPPLARLMIALPLEFARFAALLAPVIYLVQGFRREPRMPQRHRFAIEFAILGALLALSAVTWTPQFYQGEPQRCADLARLAANAASSDPGRRAALLREADWFARKGAELRRRGLWLGLTMGSGSKSDLWLARRDEVYQLGVIESMDRHEKALERLMSPVTSAP